MILLCVFGRRPVPGQAKAPWLFLAAALLIVAVQLVPLPEDVWRLFPGRDLVDGVPVADPERRWSLMPSGTLNALVSLVVPFTVLALTTAMTRDERAWLPGMILALAAASMLLGLLQFSGASLYSPLINYSPASVIGNFANRNHFALFLALACLVLPAWMFREGRPLSWRGPVGLGLLMLFALMILASGSRAGMIMGALAIAIAGCLAWRELRRELRRAPRWLALAVTIAVAMLIAGVILASVLSDRAVSIQRIVSLDVEQDMRSRAFPTIWQMTRDVFPTGIGFGGFDAAFRAREPLDLLKPTYFNQAHNDLVAMVLDAGLPGLLFLLSVAAWWAWASARAWRDAGRQKTILPRIGSAMLLLIGLASVVDYPVRTPLVMAIVAIAAVWLSTRPDHQKGSTLPSTVQHL
ncbi:hypothetical protein ASE75_14805 [Sphingomonas sp. Leaf17]|nr:hypothetical protein ASE75_14805 [Sphingomonas sp. Leaf17]